MSSMYDVLRRPLVTEKTNYQVGHLHQYVFEVAGDATRTVVKDAVEKIFDVGEIPQIAVECIKLAGYIDGVKPIDDLKN